MANRNNRRFKLSALNDDELVEFLEALDTEEVLDTEGALDEEELTSEDEEIASNYGTDEINQEDEECISECINQMQNSTMFFSQTLNMSLNISALDVASTSTSKGAIKPTKRARSPLPLMESIGPVNVASDGGFTGESKKHNFKLSSKIYNFSF